MTRRGTRSVKGHERPDAAPWPRARDRGALQETEPMTVHKIASRPEWLTARETLLEREKEHTRLGDELARERRDLPWVRVESEYRFDTDEGPKTLAELFEG